MSAATLAMKATFEEMARSHAPAALAKLAEIVERCADERAQVAAIKLIMDRAYGAALQRL